VRLALALALVGTGLTPGLTPGLTSGPAAGRAAGVPLPPAVSTVTPTGVSQDGRIVGWVRSRVGPDFSAIDYFARDTRLGRTLTLGHPGPVGADVGGAVSADGRYAANATVSPYQANPNWSQVARVDLLRTSLAIGSATPAALPANRVSVAPALSADGRYIAFLSSATDLVPGLPQTIDVYQFYLHDFGTGRSWLVGPGGAGAVANLARPVERAAVSADGRYVAYETTAGLVPGDTNERGDVYRWDRVGGATERVSGGPGSGATPSISADGRYVAFAADAGGGSSVYVRDLVAGPTRLVGSGREPALSADGRLVAYTSDTALLPGDTNGVADVFVTDLVARTTVRASVTPGGGQLDRASGAPALSPDGRWLAYRGTATNLLPPAPSVAVYEVDLHTRAVRRVT
jgi:TolB protein